MVYEFHTQWPILRLKAFGLPRNVRLVLSHKLPNSSRTIESRKLSELAATRKEPSLTGPKAQKQDRKALGCVVADRGRGYPKSEVDKYARYMNKS